MTEQERKQSYDEKSMSLSRSFAISTAAKMCLGIKERRPDDFEMFFNAAKLADRIENDFERLFKLWKEVMTNKAAQSKLNEALNEATQPDEHECDGCDGCGKCQCKELPELHDDRSAVVLVDAPEGVYLLEVSSDVWEMFRDTYLSQGIRGDNALQRALTEWVRQEAENG